MSGVYQNGVPGNNASDVDALVDSLFFGNETHVQPSQPSHIGMNPGNISQPMTGMIQGNLKDVHNATKANQTYQTLTLNQSPNQPMYHMSQERPYIVNRNISHNQNSMMQTIPNNQIRTKQELKPIQPYPTQNKTPQQNMMSKPLHFQHYPNQTPIPNQPQQKQYQSFQIAPQRIPPQQQRQMPIQMSRMIPPKQPVIHKHQYTGQMKMQQHSPQTSSHSQPMQMHPQRPIQHQNPSLQQRINPMPPQGLSQINQGMSQMTPQPISQVSQNRPPNYHQLHRINEQQMKQSEEAMKKRKRQIQLHVESNKQAKILAEKDTQLALLPNFDTPFKDINDICERLAPFHIFSLIKEEDEDETKQWTKEQIQERCNMLSAKSDTMLLKFYEKLNNQYEPTENGNIAREEKFLMQRLLFHEYQEIAGKGGNM